MKFKDLLASWQETAAERRTPQEYHVRLPLSDAAKLAALSELYPGRGEQELISDLLSVALDEIEAAFPYVQGQRVVAEDEQGDPIFEDIGLTPRFYDLKQKHLKRLQEEFGEE